MFCLKYNHNYNNNIIGDKKKFKTKQNKNDSGRQWQRPARAMESVEEEERRWRMTSKKKHDFLLITI